MVKVPLPNGAVYHYETKGEGKPLLFIHGSGVRWRMWEPQFEAFSKDYRMIMIDMRGHGESTRTFPNDQYSMYVIADDIALFLKEIGIDRIPVIGVSQGGVVGQLLAIRHPEAVEKLIVANSWSEMPTVTASWVLKLSNWIFSKMSNETIMSLMLKVYKDDEYTKRIIRDNYTFDKEMLLKFKTSPFPAHTDQLHEIAAPTLITNGDKNPFAGISERKGGITILNGIPNATLALFKDAFDPITTMRRDIFNDMALDFLQNRELKAYPGVRYIHKKEADEHAHRPA